MGKKRKNQKGSSNKQKQHGRRRAPKAAERQQKSSGRLFQGKVDKKQSGFAFLIPIEQGFEDVYVNRRDAASLMNGDIVEFSVEHQGRRSQARIQRVVERSQNKLIGQLHQHGRNWSVETSEGQHLAVRPDKNSQPGDWVVADIEKYPDRRQPGEVQITKRLGQNLGPEHDLEIAITRYGLPTQFHPGSLSEADLMLEKHRREVDKTLAEKLTPASTRTSKKSESAGKKGKAATRGDRSRFLSERLDLTGLPLVTIDGEDAKDFDDAILVEKLSDGFRLYVAIADVSFFVVKGRQLDKDALSRSTSVYFPGTCVPMLPESLSNDLCSLRPKQPRLSLVAEITYDNSATVVDTRFYQGLIQTVERLTYTQVQSFLDGKEDAVTDPARHPLRDAFTLYQKLDKNRKDRGVLDFDLPECKVQLNETGFPLRIFQAERVAAHKLIEEFMIAANQEVARALREADAPALYRVHDAPDAEALDDLNQLLQTLGIKKKVTKLTPKAFSEILEGTAEMKTVGTLHTSILRLQKQAKYIPEPRGHFGLALSDYAHFTSPIRRYPDLVVHRALKGLCVASESSDKSYGAGTPDEMISLGEQTSSCERRAMEAERFVLRRKQCWYMEGKLGEQFEGVISGVVGAGIFVNIPWMALDGFVPLEFLLGHYEIDEEHMCARQRPGNAVLHLGDKMRISVAKVSVDEGRITFAQAERPAEKPAEKTTDL